MYASAVDITYRLSLLGGVVLLVEVGEGREKSARNSMLLIQVDGTLNTLVTNNVAVGEVLSDDTASRLLLLCNLVGIALSVVGVVASIILVVSSGAGDLNLGSSKLGVV